MAEPAGPWCQLLGGSTEVWWQGEKLRLGGRQQRAVLTALLLQPDCTVRADRLVKLVWGDNPPPSAGKSLQVLVSRLRRCLKGVVGIETVHGGYRAIIDTDRIDLFRFRTLQERAAQTGDRAEQLLLAAESIDLFRGAAVGDLAGTAAGERIRAGVAAEHLAAVERHLELRLAAGGGAELLPQVAALAAEHPLHEGFAALLMRALREAGRSPEALAVFADTRAVLADELGTEPGPALRQLHAELLSEGGNTRRGPICRPAQLPRSPLHFTGRRAAVDELREQLVPGRPGVPVVVISGPGGVGKTSLAAQVGNEVRASFPDGQLYAALRGRQDPVAPEVILAQFLHSLGISPPEVPTTSSERSALLRSLLADLRVLMVLDDAADAAQVSPLLPAGDHCAVLVTSRHRLPSLDVSHLHVLDPLPRSESLQLLSRIVGAQRVAAEEESAVQVVDRCAGLPLALRVVGSRLATRPSWRIIDLARTLRSASSIDALQGDEHELTSTFQMSSSQLDANTAKVFRAGATPPVDGLSSAAVSALIDGDRQSTAAALESLVDLNLLQEPAQDRYRYHDLIREFAAGLCRQHDSPTERNAMLRRLLGYYLAAGRQALTRIQPGILTRHMPVLNLPGEKHSEVLDDRETALGWLSAEHHNCTTVATALLADELIPAMAFSQIVTFLTTYFTFHGGWPGFARLLDGALRRAQRDGDRLAEAYVLKASASPLMPDLTSTQAISAMQRAAYLFGDANEPALQATLLSAVAGVYATESNDAMAEQLIRQALLLSLDLDEPDAHIMALVNLSDIELSRRRYREAATQAQVALDAAEMAQLDRPATIARLNLGQAQAAQGNHRDAVRNYQHVLDNPTNRENLYIIWSASLSLARSLAAVNELPAAINRYQQALDVHRRTMARTQIATQIRQELAACYERIGQHHLT